MTLSAAPNGSAMSSRLSRWGAKGTAAALLASGVLVTLARPVFWQEGRFLDQQDTRLETNLTVDGDTQISPSERVPRQPLSDQTITIAPVPPSPATPADQTSLPPSASIEDTAQRAPARANNTLQQSPSVSPEALISATEDPAEPTLPERVQPMTSDLTQLLLPPTIFTMPRDSGAIARPPGRSPDTAISTLPALPAEPSFSPIPPPPSGSPRPSPSPAVPQPPSVLEPPAAPSAVIPAPPTTDIPTAPAHSAVPTTPAIPAVPSASEPEPSEPVSPAPPPVTATRPDQIRVDQFVVTGSTVFPPEDLASIAFNAVQGSASFSDSDEAVEDGDRCERQDLINPSDSLFLSPQALVAASEAIEQCYITDNFINSGAFIAESELTRDDGIVEITVVEGSLAEINVQIERAGLFGLHPGYVESRLRRSLGSPFNLDDLVEAVQLLELDPLISQISTEIVPGTETGTSILNVSAVQDDGTDVALFFDNNRSPSVGSLRRGILASQANLLGIGDRLSLGYNFSDGSNEFSLGYAVPINASNGTVGLNFQTTDSRVIEEPFSILDIVSTSREYEIFYRQPLILTPSEEFALRLSGTLRESQAEFLQGIAGESIPFPGTGTDAEGRNRTTVLRFSQEWTRREPQQVISLLSEFSLGLDAFGATTLPIPPDGEFFLWRGQGQWARRLGTDSLFILRGNAQLANGPLLPNEQFSFGGQGAGRGYRLNTLLRDNGWFLSGEFRVPLFRVDEPTTLVQIAPFLEVGGGWNEGAFPNTLFLTSTGLGLLAQIEDDISARIDWGIPLSDFETSGTDLQDSGIYFSITITP